MPRFVFSAVQLENLVAVGAAAHCSSKGKTTCRQALLGNGGVGVARLQVLC
jgi:hypothetical protein